MYIRTPKGIITPSSKEKLLGCWVSDNLKWSEHIQDNKESLILALTARLAALKLISKISTFKNRKMLANGIFLSKLSYMLAVWGGCSAVLKKSSLQGKDEPETQVPGQHVQLVLPVQHQAGRKWSYQTFRETKA